MTLIVIVARWPSGIVRRIEPWSATVPVALPSCISQDRSTAVPAKVSLKTTICRERREPRLTVSIDVGQFPEASDILLAFQYTTSATATGLNARWTRTMIGFDQGAGRLSSP